MKGWVSPGRAFRAAASCQETAAICMFSPFGERLRGPDGPSEEPGDVEQGPQQAMISTVGGDRAAVSGFQSILGSIGVTAQVNL